MSKKGFHQTVIGLAELMILPDRLDSDSNWDLIG